MPFFGKFGPKIKVVRSSWNLVIDLIWIWRTQWWCSMVPVFDRMYPLFRKFVLKNQKFLLKLKFRTQTNSNMQNSIVIWFFVFVFCFFFSLLDRKDPFWLIRSKNLKLSVYAEICYLGYFEYLTFDEMMFTFSVLNLFCKFYPKKSICQQFTCRDLKPVAFLVCQKRYFIICMKMTQYRNKINFEKCFTIL